MPYVYLDLFVLVNAVVDYALLAATAQATQARTSRGRLLLATAWGTAFACLVALAPDGPWSRLPGIVLASTAMLLLAFWPVAPRRLLALAAWFYGLACFVAGGALAVLSLVAGRGLPAGAPVVALVPAVGAAVAAGRFFFQAWRRRSLPGPLYVTLRVACEGRAVDLPALVDTGNQLRDPLTGLAVVVVEEQAVAPLLPPALRQAVAADDDIAAWARAAVAAGWAERLRIVPFASIGRERGFLAGFRPDALWVRWPEPVGGRGPEEGGRPAAGARPRLAEPPGPRAGRGGAAERGGHRAPPGSSGSTAGAETGEVALPSTEVAAAVSEPDPGREGDPVVLDAARPGGAGTDAAAPPAPAESGQGRAGADATGVPGAPAASTTAARCPAGGERSPVPDPGRSAAGVRPGGRWRALGPAVVAVFPGRFTGDQHYVALLPTALLEAPDAAGPASSRVS